MSFSRDKIYNSFHLCQLFSLNQQSLRSKKDISSQAIRVDCVTCKISIKTTKTLFILLTVKWPFSYSFYFLPSSLLPSGNHLMLLLHSDGDGYGSLSTLCVVERNAFEIFFCFVFFVMTLRIKYVCFSFLKVNFLLFLSILPFPVNKSCMSFQYKIIFPFIGNRIYFLCAVS